MYQSRLGSFRCWAGWARNTGTVSHRLRWPEPTTARTTPQGLRIWCSSGRHHSMHVGLGCRVCLPNHPCCRGISTQPWDKIGGEFRAYLEAAGYSAEEFNDPSFKRSDVFNNFNAFQQRQKERVQQEKGPLDNIDKLMQEVWAPEWGDTGTILAKQIREMWADPNPSPTKKVTAPPSEEDATQDPNQKTEPTEKASQPEAMAPSTSEANNENESVVGVFPPGENRNWYLGEQGSPFYLRESVKNMLRFLLKKIMLKERVEGNVEEIEKWNAQVYVISGASGIGKSWSINAFMTALCGAGMNIFFYSGLHLRAWKIHSNGTIEHGVSHIDIMALGNEWIYVHDSPGEQVYRPFDSYPMVRLGVGKVTLIFSSPKVINYKRAAQKGNGPDTILHLPSWTKEEMLEVSTNQKEAVGACYGIWGGNMRAFDKFKNGYKVNPNKEIKEATGALEAQIQKIDEDFARKMVAKLEKQEVEGKFGGDHVNDTPGRVLTPEPTVTDAEADGCFEEFQWHFCSPMAEKMFWRHVRTLDHGLLKKLLLDVFQTPSPKGILFEKIAHTMLTSGFVKEFRCYPYNSKEDVVSVAFPMCEAVLSFGDDRDLEEKLLEARQILKDKVGGVALEPNSTSCDSVDMFVLEKKQATAGAVGCWFLHMLQDTVSKTHSFHPVKILWYCTLFRKVFNEEVEGNSLPCWKYVTVVPHKTKDFRFHTPKSTSGLVELRAVGKLLGAWPEELDVKNPDLEEFVKKNSVPITPTENGKKKLKKKDVATAIILEKAGEAVKKECQVIFDVVNTVQTTN